MLVQLLFRNFEGWLKFKQECAHYNCVGLVVQTGKIFWSLWSISISEVSISHFSMVLLSPSTRPRCIFWHLHIQLLFHLLAMHKILLWILAVWWRGRHHFHSSHQKLWWWTLLFAQWFLYYHQLEYSMEKLISPFLMRPSTLTWTNFLVTHILVLLE